MRPGANKQAQEKQAFLHSIEVRCRKDQSSISRVTSDEELNTLLNQPYSKPIIWRGYTRQYPLHGMPSSIPEFLEELRKYNIQTLELNNYTSTTNINYKERLDKITEHFQAPPESSPPLNLLDIRNYFISAVPVHVQKADLLHLAQRRQEGSASKSIPQKFPQDFADRQFFLLSSQSKYWYLPRNLNSETYEILATLGSSIPETYPHGWIKVKLMPGDLLIMPPGCPHAVYTPEHSLAFGGNFYTLPHLGSSLRVLSLQAKSGDIFSNEDLSEYDYRNLTLMLDKCKDLMDPEHMASIASSGISWSIQEHHQTKGQVSQIRWKSQMFWKAQQEIREQVWDIKKRVYERFEQKLDTVIPAW
ncbi:hypothetical protein BDW59DRAFT_163299 [Aspergillus cavernicola]|uniref:[histone H3]-dimethyl-L-lysine(36) demethylase n=1 Tax=Aspergillus cavernicola TaxID=176166 RepID=A0ABR4I6R7_9EURO